MYVYTFSLCVSPSPSTPPPALSHFQYSHLLAAKTVTYWDYRHLLVCLEPSCPPPPHLHTHHHCAFRPHPPLSAPHLKPNPKARQCGLPGNEHEKGGGQVIAERWLRTWSCWRGDARPVLRPEAHHRDLEDHWGPLVETGRTNGRTRMGRRRESIRVRE